MMTPARSLLATAVALTCLGSLAGCGDKVPQGQVVAVVNGEEVTRRDLATEPDAARVTDSGDHRAIAALLGGVVDRKLAVAEARRLDLDRTPEHIAQAKRLDEVMLSRALFDRWAVELPKPDKRAVTEYIAQNPQRFAGRKLFLVDRIEARADGDQADDLRPLATNDAVAAYLQGRGQPFRRQQSVIDSATLPDSLYRQLIAVPAGYPLAMMDQGALVVLAVIGSRDAPLPASETTETATKALTGKAVQAKLVAMRRKAVIAYQQGYRPAPSLASRSGFGSGSGSGRPSGPLPAPLESDTP